MGEGNCGGICLFEEEDPIGSEQVRGVDEAKSCIEKGLGGAWSFLAIGGIYIDKVKGVVFLGELFEGVEGVAWEDGGMVCEMEVFEVFMDGLEGKAVFFEEGGVGGAAAESFKAHGAGSCKDIEEGDFFNVMLADVEDGLSEFF